MSDRSDYAFDGKVAIVTGAAHGIGELVAERLAHNGAKVVVADLNIDGASEVAARLGGSDKAIAVKVDITDAPDVERLVATTVDTWGRLDILVNNASNVAKIGDRDGDLISTSMETWDEVYAGNLRGTAAACKFALPHMIAGGGGTIVNIASINAMGGDLTRFAYGATKAGLITLSRYIAACYGPQRIRCNAISPGLIMTPPARSPASQPFVDLVSRNCALPGYGEPIDLAETVVFLASDASRWITGENIAVDGGLMSQLPWVSEMRGMFAATN